MGLDASPKLLTGCMGRYMVEDFKPPENSVLISIVDPNTDHPQIQSGWTDILRLSFWDVTKDWQGFLPATEEQCRAIWAFIQLYKDKNIFAHCEAGISRSGAIREYLERNGWKNSIPVQIFPNILILNYLNRFDLQAPLERKHREKEKQ
jgi:hypothetical protein